MSKSMIYVTTRREILIEHIHSLGFRDIREGVRLWRVALWRLGYMRCMPMLHNGLQVDQNYTQMTPSIGMFKKISFLHTKMLTYDQYAQEWLPFAY